ncbi:DUF445 domain-containing protein [Klenkia terrae]
MAAPLPLTGALDDPARARDLAKMKRLATGLFVVAAVVFLACVLLGGDRTWVGYVRATAEASMVGALADWFAVTALFRHPLRLPIPHTAIIPRKKDQIGESLGAFVQENFLTPAVVDERLAAYDVPGRVGEFLGSPGRAERLAGDAGTAVRALFDLLDDDVVTDAVGSLVDRKARETPAAPVLARVIEAVVDGDKHQDVLSAGLTGLAAFLRDSPVWVPDWLDDRVFVRAFDGVQRFLAEVGADPQHELRRSYDARLRAYVHALRTDPQTAARVEEFKADLLDHPAVRTWSAGLWGNAKTALLTAADDPESVLRARVADVVRRAGRLLREDETVRAKVQEQTRRAARWAVQRFSGDAAELVSTTVARWDTEETSRRIELQVGRDLQWIRVNGTVVGGLAGLVIYTVAQLLG